MTTSSPTQLLSSLSTLLRSYSFNFRDELDLHDSLEQVMVAGGFKVEREVRLGAKDRIDFMVRGNNGESSASFAPLFHAHRDDFVAHEKDDGWEVGVEVKVKASVANVERQLKRYAEHGRVGGLLVVSCGVQLMRLPEEIGGKPVRVAILSDTI